MQRKKTYKNLEKQQTFFIFANENDNFSFLDNALITNIKDTTMNKDDILKLIQTNTGNNHIQLSNKNEFCIDDGVLTIILNADATVAIMQSDEAAFEGWAICIKSQLPEIVHNVILKWMKPEMQENDNKQLHYNRFLYRALRFSELYEWFSISENNITEIKDFQNTLTDLHNNSFSTNPKIKGVNAEKFKLSETIVEYLLANDLSSTIKKRFNLDFVDRQFPVGVKQGKRQFFTGGMSAIDLWGTKDDILTIIELKYNGGKTQNITVGIISEIFMYSCITRDIIRGLILKADKTPNAHEQQFYKNCKRYKHIVASMLSDKFHPLLENEKVLSIMNHQIVKEGDVDIRFDKTTYKLMTMI